MNLLLTSAGRRGYLVEYFKEALGGRGLVHAANSEPAASFHSADRSVVTPLIYDDRYIPFLLEYCERWEIGLLVPLFDIDLPVLAGHREEFGRIGVALAVADLWAVDVCNDKWRTYEFLTEQGIPAPRTYLGTEEALAAVAAGEERFPLMVKPRWGMGSLAVFEAGDEEELTLLCRMARRRIDDSYLRFEARRAPESCVILQQKLTGEEYGLDVMNDLDGQFWAVVQKRKYAMRSGETDCAETVELEELGRLGERLGRLLKHRGNLDVDVFRAGGICYVLEMNARFGGGYPFSHMAGANLPLALVNWRLGERVPEGALTARAGVRSQKDIRMIVLEEQRKRSAHAEGTAGDTGL